MNAADHLWRFKNAVGDNELRIKLLGDLASDSDRLVSFISEDPLGELALSMTPDDVVLEHFLQTGDKQQRAICAFNTHIQADAAERLAQDADPWIRMNVAYAPSLSRISRVHLAARDSDGDVRHEARKAFTTLRGRAFVKGQRIMFADKAGDYEDVWVMGVGLDRSLPPV